MQIVSKIGSFFNANQQQRVKHHFLTVDLDPEFQLVKPYLYRLRMSHSSQPQHLGELKRLQLKVCSEVTAELEYQGELFEIQLPVWGWLIDEDVLYIRSDPAEPIDMASDLLGDAVGEAIASIFRIGDYNEFARMFLCKKRDRPTLLKRMRGEEAEEDMERIIERFDGQELADTFAILPDNEPILEPETEPAGLEGPNDLKETNEEPTEDETTESGRLQIEPGEHTPSEPPGRKALQVKRKKKPGKKVRPSHLVTDGDFAENKVFEFEKEDNPPRFPIKVGHITGGDSFGCDILSFASAEQRDAFRSGSDRNLNKVLRFIEVKGRKSEQMTIELRGKERSAAASFKERYYLYRLYKSDSREFQLSILQNPLEQKEALEPAVHVDINRAKTTERFTLTEGLLPE